jgi:hypothetical protein
VYVGLNFNPKEEKGEEKSRETSPLTEVLNSMLSHVFGERRR